MIRAVRTILLIVLFSLTSVPAAIGGWTLMKTFGIAVGCGYFFDKDNGLIGLGQFGDNSNAFVGTDPLLIFWTSDGGRNWSQAAAPSGGTGRVTSIFMKDKNEGYASIYSNEYSLWKTTDGGKSWLDISQQNFELSTCVYATSSAITRTAWYGSAQGGGSSLNGGQTFSEPFKDSKSRGNGIDFADGKNGVVTVGPTGGMSYFTQDGGSTWQLGGDLPESWGVYALKGTSTFFALPEDTSRTGQDVYWSQNGGRNWQTRFTFTGFRSFTGHIAGAGNTLYVQTDDVTNRGLYRSDNLGQTWKNVGGPSNVRDTRFVVTGCSGETVYAFNEQGEVWKTTDGGDGTLTANNNGIGDLSFADSLFKETRYCQPLRWDIDLFNPGCGPLIIDAITLVPNPYKEFTIDTNVNLIKSLLSSSTVRVPIIFRTDSNVTRRTMLRIQAHTIGRTIDTTIVLVAKHSTAPEPFVGNLIPTKVSDSVLIPISLQPTTDSFAISHFSLHLSYDGDILTPTQEPFVTYQTLSESGTITLGKPELNGMLVTVDLPSPVTQHFDLSKPLINLRMGVTLSRYLSCLVRLDTFAITNAAPLPLCTVPVVEFVVDPECGDKTISDFMLDGKIPVLFSVYPNPVSGSEIEAVFSLPEKTLLSLDIIDLFGNRIRSEIIHGQYAKGSHTLKIGTSSLPDGIYYLRLRTDNGSYSTARVVISR